MHYLQGHFDFALGKVISKIVPGHKYMSVHDLFNPELFHECLMSTINNIPELAANVEALNLPTMLHERDSGPQSGYIEQRMHNFATICEIMNESFDALNLPAGKVTKEALFRLVKNGDLDELQLLLEQLFELLIRSREVVQFITTLGEEEQFNIKDFLQRGKSRQDAHFQEEAIKNENEDEKNKLEEENAELRSALMTRENELELAQNQIHELQDQITELRELELNKQAHIDGLKRRLIAYEQTDSLFQEKDNEIIRIHKMNVDLQVDNQLLSSELKSTKEKLQTRVNDLERLNNQLQVKCDKLLHNYEILARQREDTEASNKRVITNLRDRIKNLTDRVNELQGQLVQAKIGRELREREFTELMNNFETLKSQSSDLVPRPKQQSLERGLLNSSSGHGKEFLRLEQELNQIDKLKQNAFEEQIMMFESGEDNLRKVQDIIAENARLKEKISAQENRGGKQLRDENDRLRKRLAIMKKRNDQLQSQKREELQLIISAFDGLVRTNRQ